MKSTASNLSSAKFIGAILLLCFFTALISTCYAADDGYITVDVNTSPQFNSDVSKGVVPFNVTFNVWMPDHTFKTTYLWDFGDGSTSTARNPTHRYDDPGNYTVQLTVTNASGTFTTTKSNYVKAGTLPIARFYGEEIQGIAPLKVRFTDESTGSPETWYWEFGDGNVSDIQNPEHLYARSGSYNVTLTVKNEFGSSTLMRTGDGRMIYLPVSPNINGSDHSDGSGNKTNETSANDTSKNGTNVTDATNGTTVVDGSNVNGTGTDPKNQSSEEPLPETAVPGFSVIVSVLAVLCLATLLYRKKNN